jgi:hypothetical protein
MAIETSLFTRITTGNCCLRTSVSLHIVSVSQLETMSLSTKIQRKHPYEGRDIEGTIHVQYMQGGDEQFLQGPRSKWKNYIKLYLK